jgi:hypothetical protein
VKRPAAAQGAVGVFAALLRAGKSSAQVKKSPLTPFHFLEISFMKLYLGEMTGGSGSPAAMMPRSLWRLSCGPKAASRELLAPGPVAPRASGLEIGKGLAPGFLR